MADNIVGTAYVRIRALTAGIKQDIQRGIDKGVRDARRDSERSGERLGDDLGRGAGRQFATSMQQNFDHVFKPNAFTRKFAKELNERLKKSVDTPEIRRTLQERGGELGERFGRSFADKVGGIRTRAFLLAAFGAVLIPALGGLLKIAGAYVGNLISLISSLGPATVGASAVAVSAISALVQGLGVLAIALSGEGEALASFQENAAAAFEPIRETIQANLFPALEHHIARLGETFLPLLKDQLGETANVIGRVSSRFTDLANESVFQRNFATALTGNNRVLEIFGDALINIADSITTVLAEAAPLTEFFANYVRDVTAGWRESLRLKQETGELAEFFVRVGTTLQQLGRIGENVRRALSETFSSASDTGGTLLDRIEMLSQRWRAWTESIAGQNQMRDFFESSSVIVAEVNGLIGDIFRQLGQSIADNPTGIVAFIRTIRTETLPAIFDMGSALAGLGPSVLQLVETFSHLIQTMAASGALGAFTNTLNAVFTAVSAILNLPLIGQFAGWTLAILGISKALSIVSFGAFRGGLESIGKAIGVLVGSIGRPGVGLVGALGGFVGALGPGGIFSVALIGASAILGIFLAQQQKAAQAAAEHEAALAELTGTLDEYTGAQSAQTKETAARQLQEKGLLDQARELGVAENTLVEASLGNADAQRQVADAISQARQVATRDVWDEYRGAFDQLGVTYDTVRSAVEGNTSAQEALRRAAAGNPALWGDISNAITNAATQYQPLNAYIEEASAALEKEAAANQQATAAAYGTVPANAALAEQMRILADQTADADTKARALNTSLQILSGTDLTLEQAQLQANAAIDATTAALQAGTAETINNSAALLANGGRIDTTTAAGRQLFGAVQDVRTGMASASQAAYDNAVANGNAEGALDAATVAAQGVYDSFIAAAVAAGIDADAAAALAVQYGLIPSNVSTVIAASDRASGTIGEVRQRLDALNGKTVTVGVHIKQFGTIPKISDGLAEGGLVRGPGSGTSDSIKARLSNGEFVVNAKATAKFLPLLHTINNRYAKGGRVGSMPRFQTGGRVDSAMIAAANGAQVIDESGGRATVAPVVYQNNIRVDGPEVAYRASELAQAIVTRQRRDAAVRNRAM